jgi:deoxyribodipyrimidine photo-lyase
VDVRLRKQGGRLILRYGNPVDELPKLAKEAQADAVYFHRDYPPFARRRDEQVTHALATLGVRVETFDDNYLAAPTQVLKDDGTPYVVYTRFRLRFEERIIIPDLYDTHRNLNTPPSIVSLIPSTIASRIKIQDLRGDVLSCQGGESCARELLADFVKRDDGLACYRDTRDFMAQDATSHLSPHLHFGTISVRELVRAASAQNDRANIKQAKTWVDELAWREFYSSVLWHFPHAARSSFKREYDNLVWDNHSEKFEAWCQGRTGYPIVDAGMRQLNATGWMHNRARMIVASFLTKDLLIDWRWGEKFFLQHLVDGDVASNNGGWQWAAGTGTDAQPFFRIFNPLLQSQKFDARGDYIRRWVPELARVPAQYIHEPGKMPVDVARRAGIEIGKEYPLPIVDHAIQRELALAMYRQIKK